MAINWVSGTVPVCIGERAGNMIYNVIHYQKIYFVQVYK